MSRLTQPIADGEHLIYQLVELLVAADVRLAVRAILRLVRWAQHDERVQADRSADDLALPQGPFAVNARHECALLIYVPRNLKSRLIDDATGAYGYSHVAIDVCEVDQPTGKRVMTESTTADVVHRSFQDKYGTRPFVRVPLAHMGVDGKNFRACVNAKLGERYDDKEALTWGALDDPAK